MPEEETLTPPPEGGEETEEEEGGEPSRMDRLETTVETLVGSMTEFTNLLKAPEEAPYPGEQHEEPAESEQAAGPADEDGTPIMSDGLPYDPSDHKHVTELANRTYDQRQSQDTDARRKADEVYGGVVRSAERLTGEALTEREKKHLDYLWRGIATKDRIQIGKEPARMRALISVAQDGALAEETREERKRLAEERAAAEEVTAPAPRRRAAVATGEERPPKRPTRVKVPDHLTSEFEIAKLSAPDLTEAEFVTLHAAKDGYEPGMLKGVN